MFCIFKQCYQPHDDSLLLSTIIIIVATATPYSKLTQLDRIMGSRKDKRTGAKKRKWRKNRDDKKEASSASGSDSSSSGSSSSKEDDTSESPEKKKAKTDHTKSKKDDKTSKQLASWAAEKTSAQAPGNVNGEKS